MAKARERIQPQLIRRRFPLTQVLQRRYQFQLSHRIIRRTLVTRLKQVPAIQVVNYRLQSQLQHLLKEAFAKLANTPVRTRETHLRSILPVKAPSDLCCLELGSWSFSALASSAFWWSSEGAPVIRL